MEKLFTARVTAVHKERYCLLTNDHGQIFAKLKAAQYYQAGNPDFPTAGDFVEYVFNPFGDSLILKTLPRKTFFQRFDAFSTRNTQAVAANFDTVFILTSANQEFNLKRLRRYLAAARSSGAEYGVVITKADLAENVSDYLQKAREEAGERLVLAVSAARDWGLDAVRAYLRPGSVTVFLGSSGVGKSTLVNALAGKEIMDVNGIREDDAKGRHTTTRRQMIALENGAMILDTPGMREFGLVDAEEGLDETFADVSSLARECRFRDCTHTGEPGCAVLQALQRGTITKERLDEYLALEREAKRKSREGRAEIQKRQKAISKFSRQFKNGRGGNESGF